MRYPVHVHSGPGRMSRSRAFRRAFALEEEEKTKTRRVVGGGGGMFFWKIT